MKLDPGIHIVMHSVFFLKSGVTQGSPYRWEPVRSGSGLGRYQTGPNSKFKFEFKKMKNSQKIPKNTSRCDKSNGANFLKNSFI